METWVREDKNVKKFLDPGEGGPSWDDVRVRQTFDASTGYMIDYLVVSPRVKNNTRNMGWLPPGVTHTKTVFRYEPKRKMRSHNAAMNHDWKKKSPDNYKLKKKRNKKNMGKFVGYPNRRL